MNIKKLIYVAVIAAMLAVLAACGQSYDPPKSSADLYGTSGDSGYTNDYLSFNLAYPQGYTVLGRDKVDALMQKNIDQIKSQFNDPEKAQEAVDSSIPVTMAFKHGLDYTGGFNANINIIIQKVSSLMTSDIVSFSKTSVAAAEKLTSALTYGDIQGIKLDGKNAASVDGSEAVNGYNLNLKQYFFACKDYVVIISISAADSSDMDELVQIVEGIKFEEKA